MKEERFLLSHVAYTIRKNEKLQTRIRDNGAHMMLETRKSISDKWSRRE
jgi:sensor histidine kinase YesM